MTDRKIALITGASRGIGKATAEQLAQAGFRVIGTATSDSGAARITEYLQKHGTDHLGMELNLTHAEGVMRFVTELTEQNLMPDILVNNAGITRDNLFLRMKSDEIRDVVQVNLLSLMQLTQSCVKSMIKKRWGRIINMGSVVGSTGNPGQTNYCASKAGVLGFTKSLAIEVATRNITVNTIAPGFIETDMTAKLSEKQKEQILATIPMKQLGQCEDIAQAVLFLSSSAARYITGQTLHVNGGMHFG